MKNRQTTFGKKIHGFLFSLKVWLPLIDLVGLVVLTVYAGVTIALWCAARDSLHAEHRAWVGPALDYDERFRFRLFYEERTDWPMPLSTLYDLEGQSVRVKVFFRNAGKSPALNVRYRIAIAFTNCNPSDRHPTKSICPDAPLLPPFSPFTAIFPDDVQSIVSEPSASLTVWQENRRTESLPTNQQPGLFVSTTICYEDVFQIKHFTKMCRVLGPNDLGTFGNCSNDTVDMPVGNVGSECPE